MLKPNMPSVRDDEGVSVPKGLPQVVDAHVHVFPRDMFASIRQWFDKNAWHIRYQLRTSDVFDFMLSRGIAHVIALQYAHKPGISEKLNRYLVRKCQKHPGRITGLATVFPGEEGAARILQKAFDSGLSGLKLHAHVQCFDMNSNAMNALYDICQSNGKPVVMHVGREPKSDVYRCDPYQICSADKLERVLVDYPRLRVCVPHLGFDELSEYRKLIVKYETLWLDTTMVLTDYFPIKEAVDLKRYRLERIMYGSDFPNIPYAWDRELKWLSESGLSHDELEKILNKSASNLFNLNSPFAQRRGDA